MSLIYFENRDGHSIAIVASSVIAITQNRLPTDTPVRVSCVNGQFDVRDSFDSAQQKLIVALESLK